ncbi:unnamed protein product (mitochondrion) [Plasmodiophora brassicae]|uniref:Uncharacterized protein n=1 Tax=Plasmodiophora brassicae TaxID=37360 RepID=A0A3P3XZ58_PLABS|nr:unnamed protein product [Plasmodiophora brassicae]
MAFVWDTDVPVADVCRWLAGDGVQFGDDSERCAVARALAADLHEEWLRLASLWQKAPVVRAERHPAREPPGHQIRITPTPVVAQGQTSSPPAFRPMQESSPNMLRKVPSNEIRRQVRLESATAWAHQRKSSPPVRLDDDVRSSSSGSSPARAMNQPTRNEVVVRLANIFSTIVMSRLVPHVLLEVRFLVDLLLAPRRDRFPVQCPDNRLFNSTDDCLLFSGRALDTLTGIISHLGEKLTTLLVNCDAAKAHCPKLVTELAKMPTAERTNDFNEDDLLGVDESFRPSLDSRRMFKTPAQMRLYTNREQTRDLFMEALTSYRGSLGDRSDVRQIIDNCAPPNYHFLAGLFVNQLIQQCWNDRSWLPNKAAASSDPEKLRKMQRLARRVSAPSAVLTAAAKSVPLDSDSDTATESRFTGAEKFFFRLLRDSDHHRFSQLVRAHLANKVASLRATEDLRTARIVKLMTLGKFLGFITFSPFWVVDELQSPNAVKETSQILQSSRIGPFSLNQILRNALQRGALSLLTNVPWICEMLKMSSEASRATSEIQEAVSLLRQVPRQFNSSVGACVSVAIEELFLTLRLNLEPSTSIVDDIEDRHKRDRILFAASPHLEQALAALRKSSSSAVTAAPTRMITPSRNVVAPSSVTTTLRSAFFTCNSELASLVPLILDRVVPNVVELAIRSKRGAKTRS